MSATADFLELLYGGKPRTGWFTLWTAPGEDTHWFQDVPQAAALVKSLDDNPLNVYCSVALSTESLSDKERIKAAEAAGVVGVAADVDFKTPGKQKAYPPGETEARAVIAATELTPTVLIHSGHGLQPWWLFREPWMFDDDEERDEATILLKSWGSTVQEHAKRLGYYVDSVHDLARIMRVAGTTNWKNKDEPVPVTILEIDDDRRYNPDDLRDLLLPTTTGKRTSTKTPEVALSADPRTLPFPFAKHDAILANSEEYAAAWHRTGKSGDDLSPSGWDINIANHAVQAGLSDDEVAAILVGARRKHGDDLSRPDYYARTIAAAREGEVDIGDDEQPREDRIDAIAKALGLPVVDITRFRSDPVTYRFSLQAEDVAAQSVEVPAGQLLNQGQFRAALFSLTDIVPRKIGPKENPRWDDYVQAIANVAQPVEVGEDGTVVGEVKALIDEYLSTNPPHEFGERELVQDADRPFVKDGMLWFRLTMLARFATAQMNVKTRRSLLARHLRTLGAETKTIAVKIGRGNDAKQTSNSFYGLPWDADKGKPRWRR